MKDENKTKARLIAELHALRLKTNADYKDQEKEITERKRAAKALRESEEDNRILLELAPDSFFQGDEKGNLIRVNAKASELTGYTKEELLTLNIADLFTRESLKKKALRYDLLKKGHILTVEREIKRKDGTIVQIEMKSRLMPDNTYQSFIRDITERKRADKIQNTLYNISSAVNTTENMDVLFIRIRDYLGNVIDTTNFYVALYDEKSDSISLPYVTDEKDIYKSFPAGKTLTRYVIKSGKRLFATKQLLNELTRQGKIEIIGTRSEVWMGVPLKIENNVIGLIAVQSYNNPNLYTEKDLDILDFVSEEIALAIRHKQAEDTLRKSEERLRLITENTTDNIAITTFDLKATYIYVNSSVKSLLGYEPEDLLGKSFFDFIHPDDKKSLFPLLKKYVKQKIKNLLSGNETKISETIEFRIKNKTGNWRFMQSTVNIVGKQLLAVTRDITERKLAEDNLVESEARFRSLFENNQAVMILIDPKDGAIVDVNAAACSYYGWSRTEMLRKNINEINTLTRQEIRKEMKIALHQKRNHFEFRHRKADGSIREVDVYSGSVQFHQKELLYSLIFDITERKRAEEALKENIERQQLVLNSLPIVFYTADPNNDMATTWISEQVETFTGYKASELIADDQFWTKRLHQDYREKILAEYFSVLEAGYIETEYRWKVANGSYKWFEDKIILLRDENQKPKQIIGLWIDITERKQAEEALHKSEHKYRTLFEQSADASLIIKGGKFVDCNPATLKMLGYTKKKEVLETHPSQLSPEKQPDGRSSLEKADEMMANALEKGSHRFEWDHKKKNGQVFPVEVLLTAITFKEESFIHVVWRDITERNRAERKLYESEERYRSLVEQMPDGVYRSTQEGRFLEVNPALVKILGYESKKDLMDVDIKKELYFNELERDGIVESLKQSGNEKIDVFRLRHIKGHEIWVEDHGRLIYDDTGKVLYHEGVLRDITERKKAEEALKTSEKNFRLLFENSPLGTFIADIDGKIIDGNQALLDILGSPSLEATKQINVLTFPPLIKNDYAGRFKKCAKNAEISFFEIPYTSKWGKEIYLSTYIVPLINTEGKVEKIYTVMEDISARKRAEEENVKLETQLRRAQKLETIGTLAGGIAHDFNNILAPIMGFTELALLKVDESEPIARDLNQVLKGTHRAKELVEQILLFSKQSEKERQPLNLQLLVKEAFKLLRPSIPSTIEICLKIDASCNKVMADATQIHQIIVNLCTNAWQSMENGGTLTIELSQVRVDAVVAKLHPNLNQAEYARLSVIDTGCGMDEEILERIFEPFFTTKAVDKGTGLGLSVVHGIVRNHQGDILVYSEPEKGSAFHVYLPAILAEDDTVEAKTKAITGGTEFVMIVDDEPAISEMVKMMLENFGYKADVFKTGLAAIDAFKQQPEKYDLLLSDLTMPRMTGLDLADQLHKERPELPVIIMTGFGDSLTVPTQERYDIKQVLGKPVGVKELAKAVRKVLDK